MNLTFKRIFQNDRGEIANLSGKTIERIICINSRDRQKNRLYPCVIWLKLKEENYWHRFYLDTAICICCWDVYEQLDKCDLEDTEDFPWTECKDYELIGLLILQARVIPIGSNGVQLEIALSNQKKIILSCHELDEKTELSIRIKVDY